MNKGYNLRKFVNFSNRCSGIYYFVGKRYRYGIPKKDLVEILQFHTKTKGTKTNMTRKPVTGHYYQSRCRSERIRSFKQDPDSKSGIIIPDLAL